MGKLTGKEIQEVGLEVLALHPEGIRWMELLRAVKQDHPETPHNSVHGALHKLLTTNTRVAKIAKGTYLLVEPNVNPESPHYVPQALPVAPPPSSFQESDFYQSFAEWLIEELGEANYAIPVGGNIFRGKWGTPDVVGVLKPAASDLIKFLPQIVSAEIKIDANAPVVAFGQAVAYRLFSHKSYMVMPTTTTKDDISRLDALATIYGVGLVTFTLNVATPEFALRVRATPSEPDMFYVNEMARQLHRSAPEAFNKLF